MTLARLQIKGQQYIDAMLSIINDKDEKQPDAVAYIWSFEAKEAALHIRDYCLQLLKLETYEKDGIRGEAYIDQYQSTAAEAINDSLERLYLSLNRINEKAPTEDSNWEHETSPVAIISEQLKTIKDELKIIDRSQRKIDQIASSLEDYRHNFTDFLSDRLTLLNSANDILKQAVTSVEGLDDTASPGTLKKLTQKIDDYESKLRNRPPLPSFDVITLEDVDEITVPIDTAAGQLEIKQIDVMSEVSSYYVTELATPLRKIDREVKQFIERVRLTLFRVSNRIKAKTDDSVESIDWSKKAHLSSLRQLIDSYDDDTLPAIADQIGAMQVTLDIHLVTSQFFNKEYNFLPISLLDQLTSRSLTLGQALAGRYNTEKLTTAVRERATNLLSKDSRQGGSHVFDLLDRMVSYEAENDQNTLFLRKGFLGTSFTIPREEHEAAIKNHIDLWKKGFLGALLIHGYSGSGRSALLEKIPILHQDITSYHLVFGGECLINGRRMRIDKKLLDILDRLAQQHITDPYIVTIDDIEAFADGPVELFSMVEKLIKHQQRHGQRLCLAVVCNKKTLERLEAFLPLEHSFSRMLDVSKMQPAAIEEALFIRANAVADLKNSEKQLDALRTRARRISFESRGNIGLAMHLWIVLQDDFTNPLAHQETKAYVQKHAMLINHLLANGNRYLPELKDYFEAGQWRYVQEEINAMVQHRILVRPMSGYIAINPALRYFIQQTLVN